MLSLKRDAQVTAEPQLCVSLAQCQGHTNPPEIPEPVNELEYTGEYAANFGVESLGMWTILPHIALISNNRQTGGMRSVRTLHLPPPPLPLPPPLSLRLPVAMSRPASLVSYEPAVARTAIPPKRNAPLHESGSWLPNASRAALTASARRSDGG